MANTTNFGWETPDDTDLVKDGAAAMRTLGNSIDASFVDLKGGTTGQILSKASNTDLDYTWINNDQGDITEVVAGTGISGGGTSGSVTITNSMATAIDAKGDLVAGTGADTFARLAIGANNTVLTADSSTATGLKWATPTSGAVSTWTLLNAGGTALTSGSSVTVSGISDVKQIMVLIDAASGSGTSSYIGIRPNADSGANYSLYGNQNIGQAAYAASNSNGYNDQGYSASTEIRAGKHSNNSASVIWASCHIDSADQTGWKRFTVTGGGSTSGGTENTAYSAQGIWEASAAITSLNIFISGGTFDAGTLYVLGAS